MTETIRCPDCGAPNPAGAVHCASCNFPFAAHAGEVPAAPAAPPASAAPKPAAPPPRPRPRPRPRAQAANQALSLWLFVGGFAAILLIFVAIQSNVKREQQPVEGANEDQMKHIEELRGVIEKDSSNVDARVALGDVFYDTANWSEAVVQYRAALRMDSTRVTATVDLGVCYFNLGRRDEAERLFKRALALEPNQPIALFNLGIVAESNEDYERSLGYFHDAIRSGPPPAMQQQMMQAIARVQQKLGRPAPPLTPDQAPK